MSSPAAECPLAGGSVAQTVLCPLICACNQTPDVGESGAQLKQQCVSKGLKALDKGLGPTGHGSPVKAEVNYDMTQTAPAPIMSGGHALKPTEWLPAHTKDIRGFVPGTGMVRRPDAVIVGDPASPPTQGNLLEVVEIKFPPDTTTPEQRDAYAKIAGSSDKFIELGPKQCCCGDNEPLPEEARETVKGKLEILALALTLAALVLDDMLPSGATQADDALIPGIVLRLMSAF